MKRSYVTFFVTSVMTLGLIFLLATRQRSPHDAPAEVIEAPVLVADAGVADAAAVQADGGPALADAAPAVKPADKPLRVVTLGWELAAAGASVVSPAIELAPESTLEAIETRLARGGADPQGADIAIEPLPAFVASYERLRALDPRVFLVVGFSRGREELHAAPGALMKPPPAADEVKLVALGSATAADPAARAAGSESATVLGLFALDLLGVSSARVRVVAPGTPDAKAALFAAITKGAGDERKLALSTADASRLVPIVAVAPKGVLDGREAQVREWAKSWLDGLAKTKADVPGIARRLAAKDNLSLAAGVGGAPEALVLVERLGQIDNLGLDQQTSYLGPLARGPVTLENLTQRTWQLARGGGLTANAAPEPLPLDARIVSMVAPPPKPITASTPGDAGAYGPIPAGALPLAAFRALEGDADKVAGQIFFLSGVFDRAVFRISAKGGAKAALAIAAAASDKGVAPARLATVAGDPTGAFASVDILAPP